MRTGAGSARDDTLASGTSDALAKQARAAAGARGAVLDKGDITEGGPQLRTDMSHGEDSTDMSRGEDTVYTFARNGAYVRYHGPIRAYGTVNDTSGHQASSDATATATEAVDVDAGSEQVGSHTKEPSGSQEQVCAMPDRYRNTRWGFFLDPRLPPLLRLCGRKEKLSVCLSVSPVCVCVAMPLTLCIICCVTLNPVRSTQLHR